MILVSACLAGIDCRWDGENRLDPEIKELVDKKEAIALCPEVLGGRGIPRTKSEIRDGHGEDVLDGKAKVYDEKDRDVTSEFIKGAQATLEIAQNNNIKKAILKSKSPSCGIDGVSAALLKRQGIECRII